MRTLLSTLILALALMCHGIHDTLEGPNYYRKLDFGFCFSNAAFHFANL
jgi:hypothetical protein